MKANELIVAGRKVQCTGGTERIICNIRAEIYNTYMQPIAIIPYSDISNTNRLVQCCHFMLLYCSCLCYWSAVVHVIVLVLLILL